ncbi:MAG TPA: FAD-binding oxidoreductase [Blastocatellia bacterium]|jgi:sarcosine oxidase subunit beta|nr:FAD-binding oxidoreductase [Blastocatellia bacterium]
MTDTADVVIIGGGIIGSSVAYHLAESGCANVLIIERESHQGMGSTGKSSGGVRAQFTTPINIKMSLYSIEVFSNFEEITGHTSGYKAHGYLFVATDPRHLDYLEANRRRQEACGLSGVEIITKKEISSIVPQLRTDDVIGGSFCPTDGFVDPNSVMMGFCAKARERGARLWLDTEVTGIRLDGGRVAGVETARGFVSTRAVVNAAGPWAARVARLAGVELPVRPKRRQIINTQPFDQLPSPLPMVIDMSNGFHFRREGGGILMAWPDPEETYGFNTTFDHEFIEKILVRAVGRVPVLADAEVNPRRCWAGMYEMTPDHHAIIGPAPGVEGLFLANGFSGHGVMHSPAAGRIVSEILLHGEPRLLDASPLGFQRFTGGPLMEESALL